MGRRLYDKKVFFVAPSHSKIITRQRPQYILSLEIIKSLSNSTTLLYFLVIDKGLLLRTDVIDKFSI